MRYRASRIFTAILCLVAMLGGQHFAFAANVSCPKVSCMALPVIVVAQPLEVNGFGVVGRGIPTLNSIKGQVINRSSWPVFNARLRVSGEDQYGRFFSRTVPLALPVTFPGQFNPFEVAIGVPEYTPVKPQFEIIGGSMAGAQNYQPVTVVMSRPLSTGIEVTFRNDGLTSVKDVQAVMGLTLPGSSDIGWLGIYPPYSVAGLIEPGATVTYSFPVVPGSFTRWLVFAQGNTCFTPPLC